MRSLKVNTARDCVSCTGQSALWDRIFLLSSGIDMLRKEVK